MRAMILAAGRGERMRPLSDSVPKPLLAVGGKPMILHHIERLHQAGFEQIVINLGWLGHLIEAELGNGRQYGVSIRYSHEPEGALETAGGIAFARPLLGGQPFLVINSDIWIDYPLERLYEFNPDGDAHLVFVDNPAHHPEGDFAIIEGRACLHGQPKFTYSGLGVYRPQLLDDIPDRPWPLRPVLDRAIAENRISAEHHAGQWLDIGTPERLHEAELRFFSTSDST
ncbi:MAG: N-acetylmuramate alpha-1-phosphate uridylyltransferase MurU [Pseudomonadota bacterium]